ncbi:MAG: polysaccharide deacetylase family protein [Burkholderiaceae bacterium]|nr:polysaccharide deacetylase family protein [Burkholderiaceae bacterium]
MRTLLSLLTPAGPRARLSILIFHRVLAERDPLLADIPDAVAFENWMRWVRDWFNVIPLAEAAERLQRGALPARALAITFDDGYSDNVQVAAPILRRLGLPATFFVATGFLAGENMWNDRVIEAIRRSRAERLDLGDLGMGTVAIGTIAQKRAVIDRVLTAIKHAPPAERSAAVERIEELCDAPPAPSLMMNCEQVADLAAAGFDIGGHTVTHPILARLSPEEARAEIAGGKSDLEAIVGRRVALFAYPNGVPGQDYTAEHVKLVRASGFQAAVSTAWGVATPRADPFQLPRFTPWDRTPLRFGLRLAQNLTRARYGTV